MVLCRIIEQVNAECRAQESQLVCLSPFSNHVPWTTFFSSLGFRSITQQPLGIFEWCLVERITEQVNAECRAQEWQSDCPPFLIMSPDPYFSSFGFSEHNSATIRNIWMVPVRILEQVSAECRMQKWQLCLFSFSNYVPWSIFSLTFLLHFHFRTATVQLLAMI